MTVFPLCSRWSATTGNGPLPIGSLHVRDFAPLRTQRRLAELGADARGHVRFSCLHCPRTGEVALADLRARFQPDEGLVNILNTLLPADCPKAVRDLSGVVRCGFCYGAPMTDVTPDEADEAMARMAPDDLAFLADYHAKNQVDPVWRAALERVLAHSSGGGKKSRDHRRGRRGYRD